jgi:hypothetical protein
VTGRIVILDGGWGNKTDAQRNLMEASERARKGKAAA